VTERDDRDAALDLARRRARLAAVFGDVLPESTTDDRADDVRGDGRRDGPGADEWLRAEVPPHHGS